MLRIISWLTLLVAFLFFLAVPLGVVDTIRLEQLSFQEVSTASEQQRLQIQKVETQVQRAETLSRLIALARRYNVQELDLESEAAPELESVKSQFSEALTQRQRVIESEKEETIVRQRNRLLKRSVKWNIGAFIAACLLLGLWKGTRWAR